MTTPSTPRTSGKGLEKTTASSGPNYSKRDEELQQANGITTASSMADYKSRRNTQSQQDVQALEQVQTQSLSAQQVIAVRLTEMSLDALRQRIENECLENPWLEHKPDEDTDDYASEGIGGEENESRSPEENVNDMLGDYRSEEDVPDYLLRAANGSNRPENIEYGDTLSFYDQLKAQVGEYDLSEHEQGVMEYLIGSLDNDGLLKKSLEQLVDEVEIYQGITTDSKELERLLHILWQFDPAGVGARSLQECLLIQIHRLKGNPWQAQMKAVMQDSYDDFIHKRWDRIRRRMKLSEAQAERLQREIMKLNPRPGNALGEKVGQGSPQVTPDYIVETDSYGNISMSLNETGVPTLIISPDAVEKLKGYEMQKGTLSQAAQEDLHFTRNYVEHGQMFINALAMRRESMIRTMRAIIRLQRPFFLEGDESLLRPMKLKDISEISGVSISVVSRVCNSKYVQTNFGTFPLKWFFSHTSHQADGDEVSSRKVMATLRTLVENEDRRAPLSDEQLTQMLRQQGFNIARRTVAKYREQLGLPVARMRKQ